MFYSNFFVWVNPFLVTNLGKSLLSEVISRKFVIFEIPFLYKEDKIAFNKTAFKKIAFKMISSHQ